MVYRGNHRPHHKEFSKEELEFILDRCGFKIIKHEYFDRKQGDYFIDKKNNSIKNHKIKKRIKNIIYELIKRGKDDKGFCEKNVKALMESTKS